MQLDTETGMALRHMIPDWQLPSGVDRGLHDYLHSPEMVGVYDRMMAEAPLAQVDVAFCQRWFPEPGSLVDLGCGTGRLARTFVQKAYQYVGLDLSEGMLNIARQGPGEFILRNLTDSDVVNGEPFDYAACLFSTLGMVRGPRHRLEVLRNAFRMLKPGGVFVLHVHNRYYSALQGRGVLNGDLRMTQAYGGAPLTLYHFGRGEIVTLLKSVGFELLEVMPVSPTGTLPRTWWFPAWSTYGYLVAAKKPME